MTTARPLGALALALGVALVVLALVADFLQGGPARHFGPGQLALATLGALLIAGAVCLRRSPESVERWLPAVRVLTAGYRAVAYVTLSTIGLFLVLELTALVVAGDTGLSVPLAPAELWRQIPGYGSEEWAERYWEEEAGLEMRYERYVTWRTAPFAGETINVSADGVRHTPGAATSSNALEVWLFGGSGMWGTGSPDWGTVAAYLQRGLQGASRPVRIRNLAERAYVSTQDLLRLVLELQAGRVPDMVVFYNGFNDLGPAIGGEPGGHLSEARISGRLDRPIATWLATSHVVSLVRWMTQGRPGVDQLAQPGERDRLAEEVIETYLRTYKVVDSLSRAYSFPYLFFWQPALVASAKPSTEIEDLIRAGQEPEYTRLVRRVYERIGEEAAARVNLQTLANALDRETAPLWLDGVHLTPQGNKIIAEAMTEYVAPRVDRVAAGAP